MHGVKCSCESPAVLCSCHPGLAESAVVPGLCPLTHSSGGYAAAEGLEASPRAAPTADKVARPGPADFRSRMHTVTVQYSTALPHAGTFLLP